MAEREGWQVVGATTPTVPEGRKKGAGGDTSRGRLGEARNYQEL